jgi:hypothetical protein
MNIQDAQREVRQVFRGGFMGQLASGILSLSSAVAGLLLARRERLRPVSAGA